MARFFLLSCLCLLALAAPRPLVSAPAYSEQQLRRDGRTLDIRISAEFNETSRQHLVEWITGISESLREVFGHWPRRQWLISVRPAPASGNDPIPWAEVKRGDIDRVEFYTDSTASAGALMQAWTGYHELSHLLIPYRGYGDTWFSEGLASYYQNILQARSGVLTEGQMWQKLYDGYQRGLADSRHEGKTLAQASDRMRFEGGFMRVYWSGAWYFLAADLRLRQQSGNRMNLDRALAALNACCADDSLSAKQIVHKLDDLNRVLLFQMLYDQAAASRQIPSYEPLFASLGISVTDGKVVLQEHGPGVEIRRSIALGDG